MTYLYRHALFVSRKQPYLDWANGVDDSGIELDTELSKQQRTVYLVEEVEEEPTLEDLLESSWEVIFVEELSAWHTAEDDWPAERSREMFDAWFDVELCASVNDLDSGTPYTQAEVDAEEVGDAMTMCAACGLEVDQDAGRLCGFKVADASRLAPFRGGVLPLETDDGMVLSCIVPPEEIEIGESEGDLFLRACSSGCEKSLRKAVPKALRQLFRRASVPS